MLRTPIQSANDGDDDDDDAVETMVGDKEGTVVRNKLGRSVGKAVVLLDA